MRGYVTLIMDSLVQKRSCAVFRVHGSLHGFQTAVYPKGLENVQKGVSRPGAGNPG